MAIRRVVTHGEKAAAYMADGYARASRRPGVCMAQHIGASNLAAGLRDPYLACSPVLAITGGGAAVALSERLPRAGGYAQFDRTTKFNARVETSPVAGPDAPGVPRGDHGSPGPVHLQMRGHFAEGTIQDADLDLRSSERSAQVPPYRPPADPALVEEALRQLGEAERPIIVAGGGVTWSDASEVW